MRFCVSYNTNVRSVRSLIDKRILHFSDRLSSLVYCRTQSKVSLIFRYECRCPTVPTMEANHPFHRSICMNCKIQTRYEKPLKFLSVRSKIVTQSQPAFHYKLNIFWAKRHLSLFRSILISCSQLLLEYKWFQIIPNL